MLLEQKPRHTIEGKNWEEVSSGLVLAHRNQAPRSPGQREEQTGKHLEDRVRKAGKDPGGGDSTSNRSAAQHLEPAWATDKILPSSRRLEPSPLPSAHCANQGPPSLPESRKHRALKSECLYVRLCQNSCPILDEAIFSLLFLSSM